MVNLRTLTTVINTLLTYVLAGKHELSLLPDTSMQYTHNIYHPPSKIEKKEIQSIPWTRVISN